MPDAVRSAPPAPHDRRHPQRRVAHRHRLRGVVRALDARAARARLLVRRGLHDPADGGGDRGRGAGAGGALSHRGAAGAARSGRRAACAQPRQLVDLPARRPGVPGDRGQPHRMARGRTEHRTLGGVPSSRRGRRSRRSRVASRPRPALRASPRIPPARGTQPAGSGRDALGRRPRGGVGRRGHRGAGGRGRVADAKERGGACRIDQSHVAPHHGGRAVRAHREPRQRRRVRRSGREPERDARTHRDPDERRAPGLGQRRARSAHPARPPAHAAGAAP